MNYILRIFTVSLTLSPFFVAAFSPKPGASLQVSDEQTVRGKHVLVTHACISNRYAEAIARTVAAAREICTHDFGFSMPELIFVNVHLKPDAKCGLFNDGNDTFALTIRHHDDLLKPATSKIYHLYGLCHETAHLAMYRRIHNRQWLTSAAAEGWAHYLGSHLVDRVYAREGADLWPDAYDYIEDGTKRLQQQSDDDGDSATVKGARLWSELEQIIGTEKLDNLLQAWGSIKEPNRAEALRPALLAQKDDERLVDWWERAAPAFVQIAEASNVSAKKADRKDLLNKPREVFHDDGQPAGKRSIAGGGHGARFEMADSSSYLTAIRIHGSRYGTPQPAAEEFSVWLCDEGFKPIEEFQFPYGRFARGEPAWVELPVEPTALPRKFFVCVGFNPTARKGVYVSHDSGTTEHSVIGLPGKTPRPFAAGDWMIRIKVDQLKQRK
jgi:hypothetical protein